jgi:hypothetical protein
MVRWQWQRAGLGGTAGICRLFRQWTLTWNGPQNGLLGERGVKNVVFDLPGLGLNLYAADILPRRKSRN